MCCHLQDIVSKISSFFQGPRLVCILAATGVLSSVIIHHPAYGGPTKYDVLSNLLLSFLFSSFFSFSWTCWMANYFGIHAFHKDVLPFFVLLVL
jgi:hypothetical protein